MAINTAVHSANLANKAAQVGYAQNVTAPKEMKSTEEPRRIQHLDEEGLETFNQVRDNVENQNLEDAAGAKRQQHVDSVRRDGGDRRQVQTRSETSSTAQTGRSGEALESTTQQFQAPGQQTGDVATRTLRLALADNSRQLQAQFDAQNVQTGQQQPTMSGEGRRTVMLRNLQNMVNLQLAQYTGNEPYTRSNYRQILGALGQMQGGNGASNKTATSTVDNRNDEAWASAEGEHTDGAYKLYSGQASKVLAFMAPEPERDPGHEPLELVA